VRDAAGLLDLPGFSRFLMEGSGAGDWLAGQITGRVPRTGRLGLAYFADEDGRIVTELSVMTLGENRYLLITAAAAQQHDRDWLANHIPAGAGFGIRDVTTEWSCQILTGPASRAILEGITNADLARPWLSHQEAIVGGRSVLLARVSFAGELGWELHSRVEDTPAIWDAVMAAGAPHGLRPFGMWALDSLRLEKGYRAWKQDLSTDYTVLEGGLERFVAWDKPFFRGKAALEREKQRGVKKRFVTLAVEAGDFDPPYMSTLWQGGVVVGETTSSGWGVRVGGCVALGILRADLTEPGTRVEVEVFGSRYPAIVQPDGPLWDPGNARLRA
jgi:dimethylglycine dehydrogenase